VKDQHYRSIDDIIEEIKGKTIEEIANEPLDGPHLISVDELRAAGALDVPASWRKSLAASNIADERDIFSGLFPDDESPPSREPPAADESDRISGFDQTDCDGTPESEPPTAGDSDRQNNL
jgi:hypothetical protein